MKKRILFVFFSIAVILIVGERMFGSPLVKYNNYHLKQNMQTISESEVTLNSVVPFEWDTVYTFPPYTSKAKIEKTIGFESNEIKETVNEGMVNLLFVKGNTVTGSICDYPKNLGYSIEFKDKVKFKDNVVFEVHIQDGMASLTKK
jgi:hypothetical protein